jgi:ribosomal protein S18
MSDPALGIQNKSSSIHDLQNPNSNVAPTPIIKRDPSQSNINSHVQGNNSESFSNIPNAQLNNHNSQIQSLNNPNSANAQGVSNILGLNNNNNIISQHVQQQSSGSFNFGNEIDDFLPPEPKANPFIEASIKGNVPVKVFSDEALGAQSNITLTKNTKFQAKGNIDKPNILEIQVYNDQTKSWDNAGFVNKNSIDTKYFSFGKKQKEVDIFPDNLELSTLSQSGSMGDCYFIAAIGSILKNDPNKIKDMIKDNGDGTVTVSMYGRHDNDNGGYDLKQISYIIEKSVHKDKNVPGNVWASLLEKACIIHFNTSYEEFGKGGFSDQIFESFTGKAYNNTNINTLFKKEESCLPWETRANGSMSDTKFKASLGNDELVNTWGEFTVEYGNQLQNLNTYSRSYDINGNGIGHTRIGELNEFLNQVNTDIEQEKQNCLINKDEKGFEVLTDKQIRYNKLFEHLNDYVTDNNILPDKRGTGVYSNRQDQIFNEIKNSVQNNDNLVLATDNNVGKNIEAHGQSGNEPIVKGLAGSHAYTVTGFYEQVLENGKTVKYVELYNPWGGNKGNQDLINTRKYEFKEKDGKDVLSASGASGENGYFLLELNDLTKRGYSLYHEIK